MSPPDQTTSVTPTKAWVCLFLAAGIASTCLAVEAGPAPAADHPAFIDIHVHANAWSDKSFNLDRVSKWMDEKHIERCIIQQFRQTNPRNEEERKRALENFAKYRGKIDPFCVIFASDVTHKEETVKLLRRMKEEGAIGFGEHYGRGLFVDDPKNMILYAACAEVGLPVLFHMDADNNRDEKGLPHLENAVKSNPGCTFIAHAGGWWQNIKDGTVDGLLQKYPNLHGDLSAGSGAAAIGGNKKFGRAFLIRNADKLMFGSDSGSWSEKRPAAQFTLLESFDIPADVKAKIYRENARRLFAFSKKS